MPLVTEVVSAGENPRHIGWMIWCPGCEGAHQLDDRWKFNGDKDKPSFGPIAKGERHSLLVRSGHHSQYHKKGDDCWCTFEKRTGKKCGFTCTVCHSFIENGKIRFLKDSTHKLAGQTVDLPDWDKMHGGSDGSPVRDEAGGV